MNGILMDKQTAHHLLAGRVTIRKSGTNWMGSIDSDARLLKAIRGTYRIMLTDGSLFDVNVEHVEIAGGTLIDFVGVGSPPKTTV